jgi:alpha-tubulin suppressor-like RCC1 family protein
VVEIAAGDAHTCARDKQDDVYCWGDNSSAQIGDGTHDGEACSDGGEYCRLSPTKVIGW